MGGARVRAWVDLFNIFNANSASNINGNYGDVSPRVAQIMGGRLFKIGGQFDF